MSNSFLIKVPSRPASVLSRKSTRICPFLVSLHSVNSTSGDVNVIVSKHSHLYDSFKVKNPLPIIGLNRPFQINYPDKIYLKIIYDRFGNAVCQKIAYGETWPEAVANPTAPEQSVGVYPNEIELVTRYDLINKITELENEYQDNIVINNATIDYINERITSGLLSEEDGAAALTDLSEGFESTQETFREYIDHFNEFFDGSSLLRRKQLSSFTILAYSTQDFDPLLPGIIASPKPIINPLQNLFNLSSIDKKFKIVQSVTSDLVIVDTFYNDVLCKIPIPKNNSLA